MTITAADIIRYVRDHITEETWIKGWLHSGNRHCAVGWLEEAICLTGDCRGATQDYFAAHMAAQRVLEENVPDHDRDEELCVLASYNDCKTTTLEDMHMLFEKALVELGELL